MKRPQTAGQWIATLCGALALMAAVSKGVVWAGNTQWVTHSGLSQALASWRLSEINDSIWELEQKVKFGEASKSDELKLQRQKDQRIELLQ